MKIIFLIGAGRSGTTWLQLMLGAHPNVATGQESQLFGKYLRKLHTTWQSEISYPETLTVRKHGISSYIDESTFYSLLRHFAESVFRPVLESKKTAVAFLEKSPSNSFDIELVHRCFPDATYIHLIRDCRDVVSSMLAAKLGWGRDWAPDYAAQGAREWRVAVESCQTLAAIGATYTETRYETLLSNGVNELLRLYKFAGLPADRTDCERIYEQFLFKNLKSGNYDRNVLLNPGASHASGTIHRPEPHGFFRKGTAGDWQDSLTKSKLAEIYWESGELLAQLGYITHYSRPRRAPATILLQRTRHNIKRQIRTVGKALLG